MPSRFTHLSLPLWSRLWLLMSLLLPLLRGQRLQCRLTSCKGPTPPVESRLTLLTASTMECTHSVYGSRRRPGSCGPPRLSRTPAIRCSTF